MVENGYASFRIGEGYYHMLPDDWFLVPPAYEKDQSAAVDAARELQGSCATTRTASSRPRRSSSTSTWASSSPRTSGTSPPSTGSGGQAMGTVLRLRTLLKQYPDVGYDEEALFLLGRAYAKTGRKEDAKKSFQTLVDRYPKHRRAGDARHELASLGT
jgi:outer membrane protein assembly factor BamD